MRKVHRSLFQPAPLFFKLGFLFGPRRIESTRLDEFDDAAQLISVEPDSVLLAQIYDYARATRKVGPVHQQVTFGTGNITDFGLRCYRRGSNGRGSEHRRLLFAVGADFFERLRGQPQTKTVPAFQHFRLADGNKLQFLLAARALAPNRGYFVLSCSGSATALTMFTAQEHQRKTLWAGNGCQARFAIRTFRCRR